MNKVAIHNVKNSLYCESKKFQEAELTAIGEGKVQSNIDMYHDMADIYQRLLRILDSFVENSALAKEESTIMSISQNSIIKMAKGNKWKLYRVFSSDPNLFDLKPVNVRESNVYGYSCNNINELKSSIIADLYLGLIDDIIVEDLIEINPNEYDKSIYSGADIMVSTNGFMFYNGKILDGFKEWADGSNHKSWKVKVDTSENVFTDYFNVIYSPINLIPSMDKFY